MHMKDRMGHDMKDTIKEKKRSDAMRRDCMSRHPNSHLQSPDTRRPQQPNPAQNNESLPKSQVKFTNEKPLRPPPQIRSKEKSDQ